MTSINTHPNILKIIGVIEKSSTFQKFLVLEYCPYGSLSTFLKKSYTETSRNTYVPINYTDKLILSLDIANGMEYLTSKLIVHDDLKPDNILIKNGQTGVDTKRGIIAKIANFGFSQKISDTNETISSHNEPNDQSAPELIKNNRCSIKTDVWSFGITISEARSSKSKFLNKVILKCWAKTPEERPSFNQIVDTIESISDITKPNTLNRVISISPKPATAIAPAIAPAIAIAPAPKHAPAIAIAPASESAPASASDCDNPTRILDETKCNKCHLFWDADAGTCGGGGFNSDMKFGSYGEHMD